MPLLICSVDMTFVANKGRTEFEIKCKKTCSMAA